MLPLAVHWKAEAGGRPFSLSFPGLSSDTASLTFSIHTCYLYDRLKMKFRQLTAVIMKLISFYCSFFVRFDSHVKNELPFLCILHNLIFRQKKRRLIYLNQSSPCFLPFSFLPPSSGSFFAPFMPYVRQNADNFLYHSNNTRSFHMPPPDDPGLRPG